MHEQHFVESPIRPEPPAFRADPARTCDCERPLPRIRAERKWAATTYCERCGLPLPLRWR